MSKDELESFIANYGKDIYSFCCYLTRNKAEADDLYQEAILKAMASRDIPADGERAKNFFLSAAAREWKDRQRKFAWRKKIREEKYIPMTQSEAYLKYDEDSPEEELIRLERLRAIREGVNKLPEKMRITVLLYYMEERRIGEIAGILNIPVGTVKSRLHEAKGLLMDYLKDYGDEV